MLGEDVPLNPQHNKQSDGESSGLFSSYTNLHPIFTAKTSSQIIKAKRHFTMVAILNATLAVGWLGIVIWIGVAFTANADYQPEYLLTYLPVFLAMVVGLTVECIPLVILIHSLRDSRVVPFPTIQAEYIFVVVSVFYVSAPVALSASLFASIDYSIDGCGHDCGTAEARALAPLVAATLHLVSFILRFRAIIYIMGVVKSSS